MRGTMAFLLTDPEHWRNQAQGIRFAAGSLKDGATEARMLKIAEGFELLARQAEERCAPGLGKRGASLPSRDSANSNITAHT